MKEIRINFIDFWPTFNKEDNFFIDYLNKKYHVILSDNPDYLFCSFFGEEHWKYPNSIKIFYTGENIIPDFNIYDYAIGFNYIEFDDRYVRMPIYYFHSNKNYEPPTYGSLMKEVVDKVNFTDKDREAKTEFCSFVYSNGKAGIHRKELFDKINEYKKVNSGGRFINNIGYCVDDKMEFQKKHKFAIACENVQYPGYTTEKLLEAFAAKTIPIYKGDPLVARVFNEKAFINCDSFESLEDLVAYIKEIDEDDDKFLSMMKAPAFIDEAQLQKDYDAWDLFLNNIFEQSLEDCKRRNDTEGSKGYGYGILRHRQYEVFKRINKVKNIVKKIIRKK